MEVFYTEINVINFHNHPHCQYNIPVKKTEGDSIWYQGINILAGVLLVIYTLALNAYATTSLNAVWVAIGLFTLG